MVWQGKYERLFIGGEWVKPGSKGRIDIVSPSTEQVIATVPAASRDDVDRAVTAARAAFERGPWPQLALEDRIDVLQRLAAAMEEQSDLLADLTTDEMGCPITQSRTIQIPAALAILNSYIEIAKSYPFQAVRQSPTGTALVVREPIGVVAAVIPWNTPLASAMQKLAPALLTGCSFILKPAPETPLTAYWLAESLEAAGLPAGVFSVLPADRETSEYLVSHKGVDKVAFTGSTSAGRKIASITGQDLRRVTLELGGKSAAVILDDADFDAVTDRLRMGSFRNNGQICSLKTRVVVSERRKQELIDRLVAMVQSMPVGDPHNPSTQIGPMVSARQRGNVEEYIEIGRKEGGKVLLGGRRPPGLDRGWYIEPTIFTEVEPGARIAQEEIFGPVLAIISYRDETEAVDIANNSRYGLNGSVFTDDIERGLRLARKIRTGTVEINGNPVGSFAPVGGFKDSGIGRESGPEGLDAYLEVKSIGLPLGFRSQPV
ncbi:aldehyde dehydrogenase [Arthrobacter globiformis]|uniref:Aldehyde dehydrogenase n=1 Tax=Arthrobacter globiformis TaxID=1665 RepID=A0A328HK62_ARTGO|nr:aldehyde dehydrogenase [Arthrobacter globiformis]RAM37393.1 aldehyde dehydrogenase [Arthrobacter globiformis]